MSSIQQHKDSYILLLTSIFYFHGLDDIEEKILDEIVVDLEADEEYKWARSIVTQDIFSAFKRSEKILVEKLGNAPKEVKLEILERVWESSRKKGYISEIEASSMLSLAKNWDIEDDLIAALTKDKTA